MAKYGIIVEIDRCVGCHACAVACKEENKVAPGIFYERIHRVENEKDMVINWFRVSCMHCEKPACMPICPMKAIHRGPAGEVLVDHEKCIGCMACAAACPRGIIEAVPYDQDIVVACSSKEKGAALRKFCDIGCIGCKLCERTCQHDAIHVVDNLAVIDYTKCVSCSECAEKCPRHLIADANLKTEFNTVEAKPR